METIHEVFDWNTVFSQMKKGQRVEVGEDIYFEMLGAVPPIAQKENSFYCGECYSGNLYYYFECVEGKYYGQLKEIKP